MNLELDKRVAELKGWVNENKIVIGSKPKWIDEFGFLNEEVPNFSSNINYAWPLFEDLGKAQIYHDPSAFGENKFCCTVFELPSFKQIAFSGVSAQEAICKAWVFLKEIESKYLYANN